MSCKVLIYGLFLALTSSAYGQGQSIKVGELNSYKVFPAFLEPYKKGWQLALEEINRSGGVLGRQLEVVSRDDGGTPGDAVRVAEELISREQAAVLMGTFASNVGLAVANLANQRKILFLAAEPLTDKIVWENGNRYTFRLRPSTYMQVAMLVPEAARLNKKRWAIVIPNYEYGQSAAASFRKLLTWAQPGVEFVAEQAPPLGRIDAGAVVQALLEARPEAIFSALFAVDLQKFVREGSTRGLFKSAAVVNLLGGEPEYLDPLKDETPEGWIVTGYPWYGIKMPEHNAFLKAYKAKYSDYPRLGSIVGYQTMKSAAAILAKANSTDPEKLIVAAEGLSLPSPFGEISFRKIDHQSTMGAFVGKTALKDGKGIMVDSVYRKGSDYLPSDAEVDKLRPKD